MSTTDLSAQFLALHQPGSPLLLPNPWDAGSARVLASLGYRALATTSSGFAATLGRFDGNVTRDEALRHGADIVAASELPVSADLENGFAAEPVEVAATVTAALDAGLAGCSIEDYTGDDSAAIYDHQLAVERISAAAAAAHAGPRRLVLTARAENYLHGRPDLADTISRLQAFQEAGADVLYAPGVIDPGDIASIVRSVDRPVNVLLLPGGPGPAELATLGVSRISVGGTFAYVALGALATAARELIESGSTGFFGPASDGRAVADAAFGG